MRFLKIALASALVAFAGTASAQTVISADVPVGSTVTFCDGGDTFVYLDTVIFVFGEVVIPAGCIVRGQPRTVTFDEATPTVGAPGALVIAQGGRIDAQGTAASPIIFTTGALDANGDDIADDLVDQSTSPGTTLPGSDGFPDAWDGSLPVVFLDDTPATNPLAPLNPAGAANLALWGGLIINGHAPINTGVATVAGLDYGHAGIEGLALPGFNVPGATYGGYQPQDSSGILRFASIRHGGDEIGAGNEINGLTLGGVGEGTIIENVEIYANFDDGIEFFGGTVNVRNLVVVTTGDDSIDVDQGWNGHIQNALVVPAFFDENDTTPFGADGGDAIGEWDGDDCGGDPTDPADPENECNIEFGEVTADGGATDVATTGAGLGIGIPQSVPNLSAGIWNLTAVGSAGFAGSLPVAAGQDISAEEDGLEMDTRWTGEVNNTLLVNIVSDACDVKGDTAAAPPDPAAATAAGVYDATTSTSDPVIAMNAVTIDSSGAPRNFCVVGSATTSPLTPGLPNGMLGNDRASIETGSTANSTNIVQATGDILVNSDYSFNPQGGPGGKLQGSKVGALFDPRPADPTAADSSGGILPTGAGLDASATYRGAFPAGQAPWTSGWTVLSLGDLMVDN